MVLVDEASAIQKGTKEEDKLPINKGHSELVKFDEGSEEYPFIIDRIKGAVWNAEKPQPVRPDAHSPPRNDRRRPRKHKKCAIM